MGDVLVELVWGDFKFPKGAMKLKNTLCQVIPIWRYWPRLVPYWQNILPTQKGQGFALLWNENYTEDQTREIKKEKEHRRTGTIPA